MSLVPVSQGLEAALSDLAEEVFEHYERGQAGYAAAIDGYLGIGRTLMQARTLLPGDREYGQWFAAQDFPFTRQWANRLTQGAEAEDAVRAVLESQLSSGSVNFDKAVKQVRAATGGTRASRPALRVVTPASAETEPVVKTYSTIVVDPPWRYDNKATRGAAEDHYPTMTLAELAELNVDGFADERAHLYCWVTNGFVREGFDLLNAWGFAYKTMLTWVKPQMGMGNYFRSSTEHVLFATKGNLPTQANNIVNWFEARRGKHSAKPESFYDLVERASPGPYLEMFARRKRLGWDAWGNEA